MRRMHHYQFAHLALRGYCASDPMRFFAFMTSDRQENLIRHIWGDVCKQCDPRQSTEIKPEDIKVHCGQIATFPTILIEMPEARSMGEAIFIGIVLLADVSSGDPVGDVQFRYYTLEFGMDLAGSHRTVLCQWRDEDHLNLGDGPAAEIGKFAKAIAELLESEST